MNKKNRETGMLNVELSKELKPKENFVQLCTAEEGIRNLEKIIKKTLDLKTLKNHQYQKKTKLHYK